MTGIALHNAPLEVDRPIVVLKVGGSLLDLPGLAIRLRQVLALRPQARPLLVAGGGATADVVRNWDRRHQLGDDLSHDLALLGMGLNEELFARLLSRARLVRNARQFDQATSDGCIPLLCAHCFLKWGEAAGHDALPHSWDVTSDSIAAWTARVLGAWELVLIKSVPCPVGIPSDEAARQGLVDYHFAEQARTIPEVSWCNAREVALTITPWLSAGRAETS